MIIWYNLSISTMVSPIINLQYHSQWTLNEKGSHLKLYSPKTSVLSFVSSSVEKQNNWPGTWLLLNRHDHIPRYCSFQGWLDPLCIWKIFGKYWHLSTLAGIGIAGAAATKTKTRKDTLQCNMNLDFSSTKNFELKNHWPTMLRDDLLSLRKLPAWTQNSVSSL